MDEVRLTVFKKGISDAVNKGDMVLDLGTGTGVLSFFALDAGAERVYSVDSAKIIDVGRRSAKKKGITQIEFLRNDIRDLSIPKVDCIVSELLGMEIVDEGMMEKIRMAKRFLKKDGKIIPHKVEIVISPVETSEVGLGFWKDMHGIDYSIVQKVPDKLRNFDSGPGTKRLAEDKIVYSIDMNDPPKHIDVETEFIISKPGVFTGCLMYFNAWLSDNVVLSTSPEEPQTHWKQIFIPFQERVDMSTGDKIHLKLKSCIGNTKWKWKYKIIKSNQD